MKEKDKKIVDLNLEECMFELYLGYNIILIYIYICEYVYLYLLV